MRKTPKKPKQHKHTQRPAVQPEPQVRETANADTPFDFGGLPTRDLKKNLGCG
jgi:hypothetical protein